MPAESKEQQRSAAKALAAKKGQIDEESLKGSAKEMYETMSAEQLEEMANVKEEGLPKDENE